LIFQNTVLASGVAISVSGGEAGYARYAGHNAIFARHAVVGEVAGENFTAAFDQVSAYLVAPLAVGDKRNLGPRDSLLLTRAPLSPEVTRFPEFSKDFRGASRIVGSYGACQSGDGRRAAVPCR
jgi:hypothetical protein